MNTECLLHYAIFITDTILESCPKIVAKMIFLPNKSIHSYIPFPNLRFIKTRFILSSKLILQIVSFLFDMLIIGYFSIGDGG